MYGYYADYGILCMKEHQIIIMKNILTTFLLNMTIPCHNFFSIHMQCFMYKPVLNSSLKHSRIRE